MPNPETLGLRCSLGTYQPAMKRNTSGSLNGFLSGFLTGLLNSFLKGFLKGFLREDFWFQV